MVQDAEELIEEPTEQDEGADAPLTAEAEEDAELGCTVEGGLVRL